MERLTREETIMVGGREKAACNHENDDCNDSCMYGRCRWQEKANMLLKEYEDTGLDPEQIRELKERDTAKEPEPAPLGMEGMVCPTCGCKAVPWVKFCDECGQKFVEV